jgi:hypothetical protein
MRGARLPKAWLQDSGGADVSVATQGAGSQTVTIAAAVPAATTHDVTIKSQPANPNQVCVVTGGKGAVVAGDVSSIVVNCTDRYTVGGTVVGLDGKNLILENTSGGSVDTVTVNMNGQLAFPKPLLAGAIYSVRVKQDPTANWQTCTITFAGGGGGADGGAGDGGDDAGAADAGVGDGGGGGGITGNINNLVATCKTNTYPVNVKVTGLDPASVNGVTFQHKGAENLTVKADTTTNLLAPLNVTETGGAPLPSVSMCSGDSVWTDTVQRGTSLQPAEFSCTDWTGVRASGGFAGIHTETNGGWSVSCATSGSCVNGRAPLYCFQQ